MLIILHGEETFCSRQKLKELRDAYIQKHEGKFSFDRLYADEINFSEFKNATQAGSLFDSSKLVVLENLMENTSLKTDIGEWKGLKDIANNKDIVAIFYESTNVSKDKNYKKILSTASKKQQFKKLSSTEASRWLASYFLKQDIKISQPIIKKVAELCMEGDIKKGGGVNTYKAYNELKKLYAYRAGAEIKDSDIQTMGAIDMEAKIFPTIDAVFEGKKDKAIYNLLLHWSEGAAPEYIFYMIERQLKITAQVMDEVEKKTSQGAIAKKIGQHPFVVKKTLRLINRFSPAKIKNLYARVESLDIKAKTGQLDPYLSCELLLAAVAS